MTQSIYQTQILNVGKEISTNFRAMGDSMVSHGIALSRSLKGYIPPQWGQELIMIKASKRTSMTVELEKDQSTLEADVWSDYSGGEISAIESETYFFDAVMEENHSSRLTITQHPVQDRASISDHAFLEPRELTLEIKMSDVMGVLVPGQYADGDSKSVAAYRKFCELQESRAPLVIQTRLKRYENMLIESITTPDTKETKHGLKCTIKFKEIIIAEIVTGVETDRIHAGGVGSGGTKKAIPAQDNPSILWRIFNGWGFFG